MRRALALSSMIFAAGCGSAELDTRAEPNAIIDGDLEDGYPAVGALVSKREIDDTPSGSFCSSTLIDPQWVLTAAHCVGGRGRDAPDGAPDPETPYLHFFIGSDTGAPEGASWVRAKAVHIHPGYGGPLDDRHYDIALVELERPVSDVTPIPIHRGDLSQNLGANIFYVGYGQSDGEGNGGGRKRSATLRLRTVAMTNYVTAQGAGGVCFGDSGGPGLLDVGGAFEVVGVNSTVFGEPSCFQFSTQVRVDAYAHWIDVTMGVAGSCQGAPEVCQCPEACGEDGVCDNAQCGNRDCNGVLDCAFRCFDVLCQVNCFLRGTPGSNHRVFEFIECRQERCPEGGSDCIEAQCRRQIEACNLGFDASVGERSCGAAYWCSEACDPADFECQDGCFFGSTLAAQAEREALDACARSACGAGVVTNPFTDCAAEQCRDALLSCLPDERCRLAGGDCEDDLACVPSKWAASYCRGTEGIGIGEACEPGKVSCVDGGLCVDTGEGPRCREVCASGADCEIGYAPCVPTDIPGLPFSVGVCSAQCPDADADGACDAEDCHPGDPSIHPLAEEVCDPDRKDEDCDGARNEGCLTCADGTLSMACPEPAPTPPLDSKDGCACTSTRDGPGLALLLVLLPLLRRRTLASIALLALAACGGEEAPDAGPDAGADAGALDVGFEAWDAGVWAAPTVFRVQQGLVAPGTEVALEGLVVTSPVGPEGFFVAEGAAGPYEGVFVALDGVDPSRLELAPGHVVDLRAQVRERAWDPAEAEDTTRTRTELALRSADDVAVQGAGEVPAPASVEPVTFALPDVSERYEGVVVALGEATVTGADRETGRLLIDDLVLVGDLFLPFDLSWMEPGTRFDHLAGPLQYEDGAFVIMPRDETDARRSPPSFDGCVPDEGYAVCAESIRWQAAREACGALGGRLVVLETEAENAAVSAVAARWLEGSFWIGLSDQEDEGTWRWVDGSTLTYSPWGNGEPNNAGAGEDCVHSNWGAQGRWNDLPCRRRQPYVCEFLGDGVRCQSNTDCSEGPGTCVEGSCRPR